MYAPEPLTQQFCAASWMSLVKRSLVKPMCTAVGATTTSAAQLSAQRLGGKISTTCCIHTHNTFGREAGPIEGVNKGLQAFDAAILHKPIS